MNLPARVVVGRSGPVEGIGSVPGSKSQTNRALVLGALSDGVVRITNGLVGDDAAYMADGLRQLGVAIIDREDVSAGWEVIGSNGVLPDLGTVTIDAGLAGTALRFLATVATLSAGTTVVSGEPPLLKRPVAELVLAMRAIGADVEGTGPDGLDAPLTVRPKRPLGGRVELDTTKSSQFASALLLAAPFFRDGVELKARGIGPRGYVDLTIGMMQRRGASVRRDGDVITVEPTGAYRALDEAITADASAASHLFTLAAATAGKVAVPRLTEADAQPDLRVLEVLRAMGCIVERRPTGLVSVQGPEELQPVDVDLSSTPDQLPNIAVLAALAPGTSCVRGVGITRFHETDRIASVVRELAKVGVACDVLGNDVIVHGGTARGGATLDTYRDHRLGMAFAALGAVLGDITIEGADCVAKTFADFWDVAASLGLLITPPTTRPATRS